MTPRRSHTRHPPPPGAPLAPSYLSLEEALSGVAFPITKRELMDEIEGLTTVFRGRNVEVREIVRDLDDDLFDDEEELHGALERRYGESGEDGGEDGARGRRRGSSTGRDSIEDAYGEMD